MEVGARYPFGFWSRGGAMSFLLCLLAGAKPSTSSRAVTKLSTSLSLLLLQDNDSKVDGLAAGDMFSAVRGGSIPVDAYVSRLSRICLGFPERRVRLLTRGQVGQPWMVGGGWHEPRSTSVGTKRRGHCSQERTNCRLLGSVHNMGWFLNHYDKLPIRGARDRCWYRPGHGCSHDRHIDCCWSRVVGNHNGVRARNCRNRCHEICLR